MSHLSNPEIPIVRGYEDAVVGMTTFLADGSIQRPVVITDYVLGQIKSDVLHLTPPEVLIQAVERMCGLRSHNTRNTPKVSLDTDVFHENKAEEVEPNVPGIKLPCIGFGRPLNDVYRAGFNGLKKDGKRAREMYERHDPVLAARCLSISKLILELDQQKLVHDAEVLVIDFFQKRKSQSKRKRIA